MYLWRDERRGYVFAGRDINHGRRVLEVGWGRNYAALEGEVCWRHVWVLPLRWPIRLKFGWGRIYFEAFGRSWCRRLPWR